MFEAEPLETLYMQPHITHGKIRSVKVTAENFYLSVSLTWHPGDEDPPVFNVSQYIREAAAWARDRLIAMNLWNENFEQYQLAEEIESTIRWYRLKAYAYAAKKAQKAS